MDKIIYCVGNDIRVVVYDSWFSEAFFSGVSLPKPKEKIDRREIIQSFTKNSCLHFFSTFSDAKKYAQKQIDISRHPYDGRIIDAPAIFQVKIDPIKKSNGFQVTKLLNASLSDAPEITLNISLTRPTSWLTQMICMPSQKKYFCNEENFHGNFKQLFSKDEPSHTTPTMS